MIEQLLKGGILMIPLVLLSMITVGVVIDRWLAFRAYERIDNRSLRSQVTKLLWADRLDDAALLCAKTPGPVAAVLLSGLQAFVKHRGRSTADAPITVTVKEAMDDYSIHAISAVERRFSLLSMIGNVAPLVGMLGTVLGMIDSFEVLAAMGGSDKSAVARGISEALITTAGGLSVALMAVIPYNWFTTKSDAIDLEIEEVKGLFVDTIAAQREQLDRSAV